MFKLRYGYLLSGIITGCIILFNFATSLPDGKLHIVVCDVGQGDAVYVRFPDGRDMLLDGGPNDSVLNCLSRHMPFWDRHLDMVILSHPQKDHLQGLISVVSRYRVDYFAHSDIDAASDGYKELRARLAERRVKIKLLSRGEQISVGNTSLSVLWPSSTQIAKGTAANVLGASVGDLNDYCVVLWMRYGSFDGIFPGDADSHVDAQFTGGKLADNQVEFLKVPHHGSKTGMTRAFLDWIAPRVAAISVGKNSYGHPSIEAVNILQKSGSDVHRTDKEGDIEVVSDGKGWEVTSNGQGVKASR